MRHLALLAALAASPLAAQEPDTNAPTQPVRPLNLQPALKPPIADTGIFSPLTLPPPSEVRSAGGAPGPRYWQQRVDYRIQATLDTAARRIDATEQIHYTNASPDTLRFVWLQLDQNLFRSGSTGSLLFPAESRFGGAGFEGGVDIMSLSQSPVPVPPASPPARRRPRAAARPEPARPEDSPAALSHRIDGTMMYAELAQPLVPGGATVLDLAYRFNVPEHGAGRMGREGSLYELAQWYPRMAVYDDVHGWNTDQYLGQGEFYLEYGDVEYEVTLPAGYIVAGTGTLQNAEQVLTPATRARLAAALRSDTTIAIVTADELASGAARPRRDGMLTWRFRAERVRDVAWAASPDYQWDASGWEGVLAQAYYRPSARSTWQDAAALSRASLVEFSTRWLRYPYPQLSAVEGPVSGMEYPMVAMVARGDDAPGLSAVIAHEIGHMWFPMVVGSDERRHAWMDEGFGTFITTFAEAGAWSRDGGEARREAVRTVTSLDQTPSAQPIITPANRYRSNDNLVSLAYVKPSILLLALRDKVLGPGVFDAAFREYTRRWAFKHPQPADFFRTMEEVSGRDLAWFWRGFFLSTAALDQTVESVRQEPDGAALITLRNLGPAVMPVELELGFADGTAQTVALPVEIWYGGNRYVHRLVSGPAIVRARVNPDGQLPDLLPLNDAWSLDTAASR
ncbi:MAG: M1 family metallopeptidase [Gemmatimonadota bacterium]|nr:M1 family metallopeptidase [Gemmatimonadota bacterium]